MKKRRSNILYDDDDDDDDDNTSNNNNIKKQPSTSTSTEESRSASSKRSILTDSDLLVFSSDVGGVRSSKLRAIHNNYVESKQDLRKRFKNDVQSSSSSSPVSSSSKKTMVEKETKSKSNNKSNNNIDSNKNKTGHNDEKKKSENENEKKKKNSNQEELTINRRRRKRRSIVLDSPSSSSSSSDESNNDEKEEQKKNRTAKKEMQNMKINEQKNEKSNNKTNKKQSNGVSTTVVRTKINHEKSTKNAERAIVKNNNDNGNDKKMSVQKKNEGKTSNKRGDEKKNHKRRKRVISSDSSSSSDSDDSDSDSSSDDENDELMPRVKRKRSISHAKVDRSESDHVSQVTKRRRKSISSNRSEDDTNDDHHKSTKSTKSTKTKTKSNDDETSEKTRKNKQKASMAELSKFEYIPKNIYIGGRRPSVDDDDADDHQCNCVLPFGKIPDDAVFCGNNCVNRMLNIECSKKLCPCGERCSNQRFQRRQWADTEIRDVGLKGRGLFTKQKLKKGEFVIEYVGEVIDEDAYHDRKHMYDGERHFYFLSLDSQHVIDASRRGNKGRFINHSCNPNCELQKWNVGEEARIGIFTIKDIPANAELTFDYAMEVYGMKRQKCYCGEPNCRGSIKSKEKEEKVLTQKQLENMEKAKRKKKMRQVSEYTLKHQDDFKVTDMIDEMAYTNRLFLVRNWRLGKRQRIIEFIRAERLYASESEESEDDVDEFGLTARERRKQLERYEALQKMHLQPAGRTTRTNRNMKQDTQTTEKTKNRDKEKEKSKKVSKPPSSNPLRRRKRAVESSSDSESSDSDRENNHNARRKRRRVSTKSEVDTKGTETSNRPDKKRNDKFEIAKLSLPDKPPTSKKDVKREVTTQPKKKSEEKEAKREVDISRRTKSTKRRLIDSSDSSDSDASSFEFRLDDPFKPSKPKTKTNTAKPSPKTNGVRKGVETISPKTKKTLNRNKKAIFSSSSSDDDRETEKYTKRKPQAKTLVKAVTAPQESKSSTTKSNIASKSTTPAPTNSKAAVPTKPSSSSNSNPKPNGFGLFSLLDQPAVKKQTQK